LVSSEGTVNVVAPDFNPGLTGDDTTNEFRTNKSFLNDNQTISSRNLIILSLKVDSTALSGFEPLSAFSKKTEKLEY